ncbi:hypothetical protein ACHAQA_002917 [Verticillium albo-atrum]
MTKTIIHTIRESHSKSTRVDEYGNDQSPTTRAGYHGDKTVTVTYGIDPAATDVYHDASSSSGEGYQAVTKTRKIHKPLPSSSYSEDDTPGYGYVPGYGSNGNGEKGDGADGNDKYPGGNNHGGHGYSGKDEHSKEHAPGYGPDNGSHEHEGSQDDKYDTTAPGGSDASEGDRYESVNDYDEGHKYDSGGKHSNDKHDGGKHDGSDKYAGGKPDQDGNGYNDKPTYDDGTPYTGGQGQGTEKPGQGGKHEDGTEYDGHQGVPGGGESYDGKDKNHNGEKYDDDEEVDENPYDGDQETAFPEPYPHPHPSNKPGEISPCGYHDLQKPCIITTVQGTSTQHITVYPTPAPTADCSVSSKIVTEYNTVTATIRHPTGSWSAPNATQSGGTSPVNGTATAVIPDAEYTSGQSYKSKRTPKGPRAPFANLLNWW